MVGDGIGEGPVGTRRLHLGMVGDEASRDNRIDVVAVCTPNHAHFPIAKACLEAGFDVICEKPPTTTLADASALVEVAERSRRLLGVTYTYCGHPMVHEARAMVAAISIRTPATLPASSLVSSWTPCAPIWRRSSMAAPSTTTRTSCSATPEARGLLWSFQVAVGCSNGIKLRVFGETGSLAWFQGEPNVLAHSPLGDRPRIVNRGCDDLDEGARVRTQVPSGHPERHIEAFASLHSGFSEAIRARRDGREPNREGREIPAGYDGLRGVAFVDAAVDCHEAAEPRWIRTAYV